MTDLLIVLLVMVLAVAGAELVRLACRRQLLTPVGVTQGSAAGNADLE